MVIPEDKQRFDVSGWRRFQEGDYEVLGDLFRNFYEELYYYGLKLVLIPDLVKDTIQDIFVDVWSRRQEMREVKNIKAYLFTSLRHELLRHMEKFRKEGRVEDRGNRSFEFSREDFMVKEETETEATQILVQSLKRLTDRQREVILLRFNHEMEFQEIALIMEMNVQSVRNLLFRALENIRRDMNASGITGPTGVEIFLLGIFQKRRMNSLSISLKRP